MSLHIYKIVPEALWRAAEDVGHFTGSPVDVHDGYIHFSTADQLAETARRYFTGQRDLLLVTVDGSQLELRWEPSRGGQLFPHLYNPLPLSTVVDVRRFDPEHPDAGGSDSLG